MSRKVKYTLDFKQECVRLILKGEHSITSLSKELGFDSSLLSLWCRQYEHKGVQGLLPKINKQYTSSFKLDVLQRIEKEHLSLKQACILFDIGSGASIINWQRRYKSLGLKGLKNQPKGRPIGMKSKSRKNKSIPLTREEELLKENKYLKAELDLLKKLQALAQAGEKKQ